MVSFFEKLTGSVSVRNAGSENTGGKEDSMIDTDAEESSYEIETAMAKSGTVTRGKESKDWTSLQAEGQLTVDIFDKGDKIVIQSAIAGTDPDDLDITLTHDMVTIKGTRKQTEEIKEDDYFYRELYWGAFSRSIILPDEIDESKAEASIKNGILTITLPKKNRGAQKLKVKAE